MLSSLMLSISLSPEDLPEDQKIFQKNSLAFPQQQGKRCLCGFPPHSPSLGQSKGEKVHPGPEALLLKSVAQLTQP